MSLLLCRTRPYRGSYTPPATPGGGDLVLDAQLVNFGSTTSGTLRFTGIFETAPGDLTQAMIDDRKVAIFDGATERACHIEAARGHHADGTLRGFRYDFDRAVSSGAAVTGFTVVIGTVRATTDISRRTITETEFLARRWMVGTSPSYMTETWATGTPLVPASSWNAHETAWLKTMVDSAITARDTTHATDSAKRGAATYNTGRVFKNLHLCTGDASYLHQLWLSVKRWLDTYHLPTGTDPSGGYGAQAQIDVESLNRYATAYAEQYSIMEWDFYLLYMLTGWSYPWSLVNNYGQRAYRQAALSATNNFNGQYGIRFNLRDIRWVNLAYLADATYTYGNPDFSARACNFGSEIPNLLAAADYNKYDTSKGAYRANLRGQHTGVVNTDIDGGWGAGTGDHPTFWLSVYNDWEIDAYHNVKADAGTVDRIATNFGIAMANASQLPALHYYVANFGSDPAKFAVPYRCTSTASTSLDADGGPSGSGGGHDPFDVCMFAKSAAFLSAVRPSDTFNGKTAAQWLDIITNVGQMSGMTWNDKFIGETAQAFAAPYYRLHGDPGGPASFRSVTTHTNAPS